MLTGFWREFRSRIRSRNPEAYIVGEVWTESQRWLQGDMWDAVMNYLFTRACIGFFIGDRADRQELDRTSLASTRPLDAGGFRNEIARLLELYHPNVNSVMLNLLSSHDMARFVTLARGDQSALRLATLFQMTYVGAPSIYYGDEIGMSGGHDPANRGAFPWDDPRSWDRDLLHDFQRMISLRKESPALRRGTYRCLHAEGGVHVHERRLDRETVIVALNAGRTEATLAISVGEPDGTVFDEVWTRERAIVKQGRIESIRLEARSGRVFRTADVR